jgi:two-component system, LytTR family, sensor kinase
MARWNPTNLLPGNRGSSELGLASRQAVHEVLAFANRIAPPLRGGLSKEAFAPVVGALRLMLSAQAVAVTDTQSVLAWDAENSVRPDLVDSVLSDARPVLMGKLVDVQRIRAGENAALEVIVQPLELEGHIAGTLVVYVSVADLALVQASEEVAHWISMQVKLGELDRSHAAAAGAQLRALRAQISPHFLFNALNTIASFVRTDPDRARDLLVEFADFARYSFSTTDQFTTLADELRAIDTFVALERARFGDRLTVRIRVAPEVLGVKVPFLVLQPLVENALQHGLYRKGGRGTLTIDAKDLGSEALIEIEDDGVGMSPEVLAETLSGKKETGGIGIRNVDQRLRTVFGPRFGLVVETNVGAGTKMILRIPKTLPAGVME